ncbi:tetratricopeptide repeat protein [Albibacterium sp.]|uniref:tetratricopeptide repeat protein n=1 Tax=Albibacterium sp. TaxID=2952885 RepID=UPI002C78F9A9|nr:tetratricopeptide repeat protein [Albibacterium sp.]HUH19266.1 tetratricopeptide repeat protein [Albibacterium sp.]
MFKKFTQITLALSLIAGGVYAQQSAWQEIDKAYKSGMELYERGKYVAAAKQFDKVETTRIRSVIQEDEQAQVSLLKEKARFYQAVCALEVGNKDAEDLFMKYIKDYPTSSNTKAAYYQVGRSYFAQTNYDKAIEWFEKLDGTALTGSESSEYRFKLAYSYFKKDRNSEAKPMFERLKNERSAYNESAIYYYAYLAYLDGEYKTALSEFERLKGSKQFENSYPYYIASLYYLDGRYDDVLAYAIPILETTNQESETDLFRIVGATYFSKGDLANSKIYYDKYQAADQGKTQSNQDTYNIGYIAFKNGNNEKAIAELEKLDQPEAYYQAGMITLGDAFLKAKNKESARNAFFRASKLDFDPQLKEEGALNYAKLSYELEFHQVALEATQEYLRTYPTSTKINEAKTLLAEILLSTKNYNDAVDILETIANRSPEANAAYQKVTYFRGLEHYNERAFENAISLFMRSESHPIDPEIQALATYWKAEAMYEVRKYGEAVVNFDRFLRYPAAKSTSVYNYANYALAYAAYRNSSFSTAANYFERFLASGDADVNTRNDAIARLGDSYFSLRSYDRALAQYNKLITSKASSEDYALYQRGIIQGLQGQVDTKIATLLDLQQKFPNSNYSDDAAFEIPYSHFLRGDYDVAITGLQQMVEDYPRSSYVPRALVTIGLVHYNNKENDEAIGIFKRVVDEYSTTDEAKLALKSIQNIYIDNGDAQGYLSYALSTNIGDLTTAEQDNITFQAANGLFVRGEFAAAVEAINAYFDKFPKPIQEKFARFIRAESLWRTGKPTEALHDYNIILNDWTSPYTERTLLSVSELHLQLKQYNEAVATLKKLELTADYKANYGFAINNLMLCYFMMGDMDEALKYANFVIGYEKSSQEEVAKAHLFAGKAYLAKDDKASAKKEFDLAAKGSQTIVGAEAKYNYGQLQFDEKGILAAQKTAFDLIKNMPSYDYWVAKSFILLADTYVALKDDFQAKSTLESIIENYEKKDDDIIPEATKRLDQINNKK